MNIFSPSANSRLTNIKFTEKIKGFFLMWCCMYRRTQLTRKIIKNPFRWTKNMQDGDSYAYNEHFFKFMAHSRFSRSIAGTRVTASPKSEKKNEPILRRAVKLQSLARFSTFFIPFCGIIKVFYCTHKSWMRDAILQCANFFAETL